MLKKIFKNTFFKIFLVISGLAILVLLLQHLNLKDAVRMISQLPTYFILIFLVLSFLTQFFKSIAYYYVLQNTQIDTSLTDAMKVFFASQLMTFLPGGEVGRVVLTKSEGDTNTEKAGAAVISQVLVETVSGLIVVLIGSFYLDAFKIPALISLAVIVFLLSIVLSEVLWKVVLSFFLKIKYLQKYQKSLEKLQLFIKSQIFLKDSRKINYSFFKVLLFAFISHLVGGLFIYSISVAYGLNLNIISSIFVFSTSLLIQGIVSIIPGGFGGTEGGLIGILLFFGNSVDKSFALTITFRTAGLLFNIFTGLVVYLIFYRKSFKGYLKE